MVDEVFTVASGVAETSLAVWVGDAVKPNIRQLNREGKIS